MKKCWNFAEQEGERVLYLEGAISDESWWGDEVTPKLFKADLNAGSGDITVWINSPGGDVFAAAEIYSALKEYPGKVTVKISAIAASAASIVAMSGDEVLMSPVAGMMIHNPGTIAIGDSEEMLRAKAMLDAVKESIINAYEQKSKLPRGEISALMDGETWMFAQDAIEKGFADGMLYDNVAVPTARTQDRVYSRMTVMNSLLNAIPKPQKPGKPIQPLYDRLDKLV